MLCKLSHRPSDLLDEQMWLLGQDIRYEGGNLLIRYGCRRERDPADMTSAYVHRPDAKSEIVLWGFGLMYGIADQGAVFLRRGSFHPRWTQQGRFAVRPWDANLIARQTKPSCESDRSSVLLRRAAFWLASYENWVLSIVGVDYRRQCVDRWRKKRRIAADEVANEWQRVAEEIECSMWR